jgi:hypothetical protein
MVWAVIAGVLLAASPARAALPTPVPDAAIVTDGTVAASAIAGSTLYLGGSFTAAGPRTGPLAALDPATGALGAGLPEVTGGSVSALVADGAGGWFIGGDFIAVGGVPASGLAHVRANGTLDTSFDVWLDGPVGALALEGGRLYVGGSFSQANGAGVRSLIAVDPATGVLLDFRPDFDVAYSDVGRAYIRAIVPVGDKVFVAGHFTRVGAIYRDDLVQLRASDGTATTWSGQIVRSIVYSGDVAALAVAGNTLYVGGLFFSAGGNADTRNLAALNLDTGLADAWAPRPISRQEGGAGAVAALAVDRDEVLVAGSFDEIAGVARPNVAAISRSTGAASAWNPSSDGGVTTLLPAGPLVYLGGEFRHAGGAARRNLAAVSRTTGAASGFVAHASAAVSAIALGGERLAVGGAFSGIGLSPRENLAAMDLSTGVLLPWAPAVDGAVEALATAAGRVFAGGSFLHVGAAARPHLAALSSTGALDAWDPGPLVWESGPVTIEPQVESLAIVGDRLYIGGFFTSIGGRPRSNLARVGTDDAAVDSWAPAVDGVVRDVVVDGLTAYVAGGFSHAGGQARNSVAALRTTDASVTPFDPQSGGVLAVAPAGATVFLGGYFKSVRGAVRNKLAAVRADDGTPLAWAPDVAPMFGGDNVFATLIDSLAVTDSVVYAGGLFEQISGRDVSRLAALDRTTGATLDWLPDPGPYSLHTQPEVLKVDALPDGRVLALGTFSMARFGPAGSVGLFGAPTGPVPRGRPVAGVNSVLGTVLTCTPPAFATAPAGVTFEWLRDRAAFASGTTHVLEEADVGHEVSCRVTPTGGVPASSRALTVMPQAPFAQQNPVMAGEPRVGATLSCTPGTWAMVTRPFVYAWLRFSFAGTVSVIPGATSSTYTVQAGDAPGGIACSVTASNPFGSVTRSSTAYSIATVYGAPGLTGPPAISGSHVVGARLTCSNGQWTGVLPFSYAYQWLRDGAAIGGATAAVYTVVAADAGHALACRVTNTSPGGSASASSASVPISGPAVANGSERFALSLASKGRLAAILRSGLRISVAAPRPGRLTVTVTRGKQRAGNMAKTLERVGRVTVTVKLTSRTRRALAKSRRVQFTVSARLTSSGRPPLTVIKRVTLRR